MSGLGLPEPIRESPIQIRLDGQFRCQDGSIGFLDVTCLLYRLPVLKVEDSAHEQQDPDPDAGIGEQPPAASKRACPRAGKRESRRVFRIGQTRQGLVPSPLQPIRRPRLESRGAAIEISRYFL